MYFTTYSSIIFPITVYTAWCCSKSIWEILHDTIDNKLTSKLRDEQSKDKSLNCIWNPYLIFFPNSHSDPLIFVISLHEWKSKICFIELRLWEQTSKYVIPKQFCKMPLHLSSNWIVESAFLQKLNITYNISLYVGHLKIG